MSKKVGKGERAIIKAFLYNKDKKLKRVFKFQFTFSFATLKPHGMNPTAGYPKRQAHLLKRERFSFCENFSSDIPCHPCFST